MTYDEFVSWATEKLVDAIITGGFSKLKETFKYVVLQALYTHRKTIFKD